MTYSDHNALLDQLQAQVNLVLEQTGRVFAAVTSNPRVPPVAQITKLQHVLPAASNRFHQALDQLENELQMAALTMRRDLAVCREKSSISGEATAKGLSESIPAQETNEGAGIVETQALEEKTESLPKEDVPMQDAPQDLVSKSGDAEEKPAPPDGESTEPVTDKQSSEDAKADVAPEADAANAADEQQSKQPGGTLHIETTTAKEESMSDQKPAEEKAPDTATGDLDSLFNDPASAGDTAASNAFNFDQDNSNELDFGSFGAGFDSTGADNDNISSLLPGLEDYANTQTNGATDVMDFGSFFDTGGDSQNNGMDQQGSGEQRDTTFDDLMDLANFEGLDGDDNNNSGNNHNAELDFEALFN